MAFNYLQIESNDKAWLKLFSNEIDSILLFFDQLQKINIFPLTKDEIPLQIAICHLLQKLDFYIQPKQMKKALTLEKIEKILSVLASLIKQCDVTEIINMVSQYNLTHNSSPHFLYSLIDILRKICDVPNSVDRIVSNLIDITMIIINGAENNVKLSGIFSHMMTMTPVTMRDLVCYTPLTNLSETVIKYFASYNALLPLYFKLLSICPADLINTTPQLFVFCVSTLNFKDDLREHLKKYLNSIQDVKTLETYTNNTLLGILIDLRADGADKTSATRIYVEKLIGQKKNSTIFGTLWAKIVPCPQPITQQSTINLGAK